MKQTKILFALVAVLFIPFAARAHYFEVDGIVYGVTSDETVEVWPKNLMYDSPYSGAVTIPGTVEHDGINYRVTALGNGAFEGCHSLTSLTLPPTISRIGSHCFYDCTLTTLQLPDSLRRIDDHAFLSSIRR